MIKIINKLIEFISKKLREVTKKKKKMINILCIKSVP